jgi:hypothetical protein
MRARGTEDMPEGGTLARDYTAWKQEHFYWLLL